MRPHHAPQGIGTANRHNLRCILQSCHPRPAPPRPFVPPHLVKCLHDGCAQAHHTIAALHRLRLIRAHQKLDGAGRLLQRCKVHLRAGRVAGAGRGEARCAQRGWHRRMPAGTGQTHARRQPGSAAAAAVHPPLRSCPSPAAAQTAGPRTAFPREKGIPWLRGCCFACCLPAAGQRWIRPQLGGQWGHCLRPLRLRVPRRCRWRWCLWRCLRGLRCWGRWSQQDGWRRAAAAAPTRAQGRACHCSQWWGREMSK